MGNEQANLWLLFDGACTSCQQVADSIAKSSGGRIRTESLFADDGRKILDQVSPGWVDEPHLVEVSPEGVTAYTGRKMAVVLTRHLGPRRATQIAGMARRAHRDRKNLALDRRRFLARAASGLAVAPFLPTAIMSLDRDADSRGGCKLVGTLRDGDPVLATLKRDQEIVAAQEIFGGALWNRTQHYRARESGHVFDVYTLDLPGSKIVGGAARLYVIPVAGSQPVKVVTRFPDAAAGTAVVELWTATGQLLGRATHKNGQTRVDETPDSPVPPVDIPGYIAAANRYAKWCSTGGEPPQPDSNDAPRLPLGGKTKCFLACIGAVTGIVGSFCFRTCKAWVQYRHSNDLLNCLSCTGDTATLFILCCIVCGLKPPDDDDIGPVCQMHP